MAVGAPLRVECENAVLIGEQWGGTGPTVVLLHAGVTDRRSWHGVVESLNLPANVVAYDRRGFGETAPPAGPFSHLKDLFAVLDRVADGPVWLVGSSAGGEIALDAAVSAPERVAGLVLLAPGVSGAPTPELDAATARFDRLLDEAIEAGDDEEVNRLEAWLWLDGPGQREGRVPGSARALMREMNAVVLANGAPPDTGSSGLDAWAQVEQVTVPATVACGALDVPFLVDLSRTLAERLPNARHRELPAVAHLPQLEQPDLVAELVTSALSGG